jgi:hypothetical protein
MMLRAGVRRFGVGKWKHILTAYPFNSRRSSVDLKDKWRNILKKEKRRVHIVGTAICTGTDAATFAGVEGDSSETESTTNVHNHDLQQQEPQYQYHRGARLAPHTRPPRPMDLSSLLS